MKRPVFVVLLLAWCCTSFTTQELSRFEVEFVQDGETIYPEDGEVFLQRKPFTFRIKLYNLEGVFLNASLDDRLFKVPAEEELPDFRFIHSKVLAEARFNAEKTWLLSKSNFAYWYYDPAEEWHRFDSVQVMEDHVIGVKSVEKVFDNDAGKALDLHKIKPVYLVFVSARESERDKTPVEIARSSMVIRWEK